MSREAIMDNTDPKEKPSESFSKSLGKLTNDYFCFDTLHAVLPPRLQREKFYQNFADLYSQSNVGPYYELVQAGKMTVEDCKRGKIILDAMANWERYIDKDPVLGKKRL